MKHLFLALSIVTAVSIAAFAQKPCEEYAPSASIFSMCPPSSLIGIKAPEQQLLIFGKAVTDRNPFTLTIVELADSNASVYEFGYGFIARTYADTNLSKVVLKEVGDFVTTSGAKGVRLVFEMDRTKKERNRKIQYIFKNPASRTVIFTALVSAAAPADTVLADAAIKSVRIK